MRMLNIETLPEDDNVLKMFKEDRHRSVESGESTKEFVTRETKKLFGAYLATDNKKYYRAYQILTEMFNRQRG